MESQGRRAGRSFAQFLLGYAYDYGKGVEKNATEAATWYRKAADQGDGRAMGALGYPYSQGNGVLRATLTP
jgi:TPR repeat protein